MDPSPIQVRSEIGPLRRVLLHRPGQELENLMPDTIQRLLFDDIPYLKLAQEEHDRFCQVLRDCGAEVVYLEDLTAEALSDPAVKRQFVLDYIRDAGIHGEKRTGMIADYFLAMSTRNMVLQMMAGVRKADIRGYGRKNLTDYLGDYYPFVVDPMPNLYFTRDPFATIGTGVSLHRMHTVTRNRETLFGKFIFQYHPRYEKAPKWYDRGETSSLEGGDILVLSPQVLAVGISQRTKAPSSRAGMPLLSTAAMSGTALPCAGGPARRGRPGATGSMTQSGSASGAISPGVRVTSISRALSQSMPEYCQTSADMTISTLPVPGRALRL